MDAAASKASAERESNWQVSSLNESAQQTPRDTAVLTPEYTLTPLAFQNELAQWCANAPACAKAQYEAAATEMRVCFYAGLTSPGNIDAKQLSLSNYDQLTSLPEAIGTLKGLKALNLMGCVRLAMLPLSLRKLEALIILNLNQCTRLLNKDQVLRTLPSRVRIIEKFGDYLSLSSEKNMDLRILTQAFVWKPKFGQASNQIYRDFCDQARKLSTALTDKAFERLTNATPTRLAKYLKRETKDFLSALPEVIIPIIAKRAEMHKPGAALSRVNRTCRNQASEAVTDLNFNTPEALMKAVLTGRFMHIARLRLSGNFSDHDLLIVSLAFPKLTSLELIWCKSLTNLNPLAKLTALTALKFSGGKQEIDIEGIAELTTLTSLDLARLNLPASLNFLIIKLTALTTLKLSECKFSMNLGTLPKLTGLTSLELSWCDIPAELNVLAELATLTTLSTLRLCACKGLKELGELTKLTGLTSLELSWCDIPAKLNIPTELTTLTTLKLRGCKRLKELGEIIKLTALTSIDLSECEELTTLPSFKGLTALTMLNLEGCEQLTQATVWRVVSEAVSVRDLLIPDGLRPTR